MRIWNLTLAPRAMTSMHIHDFDVWFLTTKPSTLSVFTQDKVSIFENYFYGTLGFKLKMSHLIPIGVSLPANIPT